MELRKAELRLSVEEYLIGECQSEVRHEYIGGEVYAMAGASEEHNVVAGNAYIALATHLRGRRCRAFMTDMKVRLQIVGDEVLYYPDLMVTCDPRDTDRHFKRYPSVLVEVLSPDTERTDRREKLLSYLRIETLETYILVAQDRMEVTVFRRSNQWQPEILREPSDILHLPHLEFQAPLSAIYEGLSATPDGKLRVTPL
jgi:Uma2 family endonuclease